MRTEDKKKPALIDTDRMPFGKFKGERMQDIPPSYLRWLYDNIRQNGVNRSNELVYNYIYNSKEAIEMELGEEI